MFLATSAPVEVLVGVIAAVVAALAAGVSRAVVQSYKKHQLDERDTASIYERLYGKPANPRTNEPAIKGWTTHVDERLDGQDRKLDDHGRTIHKVSGDVSQLLEETRQNARLAHDEVKRQVDERQRVGDRDDKADE